MNYVKTEITKAVNQRLGKYKAKGQFQVQIKYGFSLKEDTINSQLVWPYLWRYDSKLISTSFK